MQHAQEKEKNEVICLLSLQYNSPNSLYVAEGLPKRIHLLCVKNSNRYLLYDYIGDKDRHRSKPSKGFTGLEMCPRAPDNRSRQ